MSHSTRTNSDWIDALCGKIDELEQEAAINELARYLYVVIYNTLRKRRRSLLQLNALSHDELTDLTHDFTQLFMEKMIRNNYALLDKYDAKGRFTAWAAQVALNLVADEFRRVHWSRQMPLQDHMPAEHKQFQPEFAAINGHLRELLEICLAQLPDRMRIAFIRRVIEGENARSVADEMETTPNTVNILVHRAKKIMRKVLTDEGFGGAPAGMLAE